MPNLVQVLIAHGRREAPAAQRGCWAVPGAAAPCSGHSVVLARDLWSSPENSGPGAAALAFVVGQGHKIVDALSPNVLVKDTL